MKLKRILIVEDEILIANLLKQIILDHGYECAGIAISYNKAVKFLIKYDIDAVLLDVNLYGDKSGVQIGKLLKYEYKIPFIYLTSHTDAETISEIMLTGPVAYLVKPIQNAALTTTLDLLFANGIQHTNNLFDLKDGTTVYRIDLTKLQYIKSDGNYLEVHLSPEKKVIRSSISKIIETLPLSTLFQINRRIAINPKFISEIKGSQLILKDGTMFKISELRRNELPFV